VSAKSRPSRRSATAIACAFFAALTAIGNDAKADHRRDDHRVSVESRAAGEPILAIVSLRNQRITIYDADGWILRSSVSSGQRGRETPAGIFSIIQKEAEHYSNLYDDAYMPNMQRLTWSGIAMHGGVVPGYPASHGCVRMPYHFAERLFGRTQVGLRVIVSPTDVVPAEIVHPILSRSKQDDSALSSGRMAQADDAAQKADQARRTAGAAYREATRAMVQVRIAESQKRRAEAQLAAAETALSSAISTEDKEQAERSKSEAAARIADAEAQLSAAKTELQPKLDALKSAREDAIAAGSAQAASAETTRQAAREHDPISVLVSRKTQRLYVRRDFEPLFDSPVTIVDADRPIGTHVYTATAKTSGGMRWSVVSLSSEQAGGGSMDESATSALDRIVIPQDALDRISWIAPRSSLIITDEVLSSETGKGTDFVVILSGQPQGGIKMRRRHAPETDALYTAPRDRMPNWRPPVTNWYSTW
jgi:L,D-transpeptidase catalytic domain